MQERRRYPRANAGGTVRLYWSAPRPTEVEGQLKDISAGGFRAAHGSTSLEAGQEVEFIHPYGEGRARVMWTRVSAGTVESGFMQLDEAPSRNQRSG
jgi:PilZ domain